MANDINTNILVVADPSPKRVFLPSENINIFPCSRRGRQESDSSIKYYDPEARLNTERTNRLHTAVNGFKDSFVYDNFVKDRIKNEDGTYTDLPSGTLRFVLAGYHIEVKNFDPGAIAARLGGATDLYAYLCLLPNVSIDAADYFTEILYRQSTKTTQNQFLDIQDTGTDGREDYFFVGVSFVKEPIKNNDYGYNLPIFSYSATSNSWELVQTSLLPKIEHGETKNSVKLSGNLTIEYPPVFNDEGEKIDEAKTAFEVTKEKVFLGYTEASELSVNKLTAISTISTPKLETNIITSNTTDIITVQKPLDIISTNQTKIAGPVVVENTLTADNIKVDPTGTLDVKTITNTKSGDDTITINAPLSVTGKTTLTNDLEVTKGDTSLKKLDAEATTLSSLIVATDNFTVTDDAATFKAPVTVNNSLEVTSSVKTQALDVKTIENTQDNTGVGINDTLTITSEHSIVADTLKVNTINSRATNGTIIAKSPVKVDNTLEVVSNATLESNLTVGTDNNANTGTIDAKKLVKVPTLDVQTIKNTKTDATTGANLGVSIEDALSITGATSVNNTITAKKLVITDTTTGTEKGEVKTPQLRVNRITSDDGTITIDGKKLAINKSLEMLAKEGATEPAKATIEQAAIGDLTVEKKDTLKGSTGKITAEEVWLKEIGPVPALEMARVTDDTYQLRFKFGSSLVIKDERPQASEE